jgi:putative DNA primase/helicase
MSKNKKPTDVVLSRDTPAKSADAFRAACHPHLINQQEEWYTWTGAAYQRVEEETIRSGISEFCEHAVRAVPTPNGYEYPPFNPKSADVNGIYEMLLHRCHRPNTTEAPAWLDGRASPDPHNIIACRNGLIDITTRQLYDFPDPNLFTTTALPLDYVEKPPAPTRWLQYLREVTNDRPELITALQEIAGYLIASDTSQQRVFFLLGPKRSGKGTFLKIIHALIGKSNVAAPTIENVASHFGMRTLMGKSLAMVTDMNCQDKAKLSTAANRINAVSGEDPVQADRKFKEAWEGRLPTRFLMAGNKLPNFGDHAEALAARLLVIPFDISFHGREDRRLERTLLAELPGILVWALEGLARLNHRGRFTEPKACTVIKSRLLNLSEPVRGFRDECLVCLPDAAEPKAKVYNAYKQYCETLGTRPLDLNDFAERLYGLVPGSRDTRLRVGGKQVTHFTGLRMRQPSEKVSADPAVVAEFFEVDQEKLALGFTVSEAVELDGEGRPKLLN